MSRFEYHTGGVEQLNLILPLWEKLKAHDAALPGYFSEEFRSCNFCDRKAAFLEKSKSCDIFIDLASLPGTRNFIAYSISALSPDKQAEIENIFVDERYRGCGIGSELMKRALARLDSLGAMRKSVVILSENHAGMRFYARFGFYPRTTNLAQV